MVFADVAKIRFPAEALRHEFSGRPQHPHAALPQTPKLNHPTTPTYTKIEFANSYSNKNARTSPPSLPGILVCGHSLSNNHLRKRQ